MPFNSTIRTVLILDQPDGSGRTPLGLACGGPADLVEILLERGASLERVDHSGLRPLDRAIGQRNVPVIIFKTFTVKSSNGNTHRLLNKDLIIITGRQLFLEKRCEIRTNYMGHGIRQTRIYVSRFSSIHVNPDKGK